MRCDTTRCAKAVAVYVFTSALATARGLQLRCQAPQLSLHKSTVAACHLLAFCLFFLLYCEKRMLPSGSFFLHDSCGVFDFHAIKMTAFRSIHRCSSHSRIRGILFQILRQCLLRHTAGNALPKKNVRSVCTCVHLKALPRHSFRSRTWRLFFSCRFAAEL